MSVEKVRLIYITIKISHSLQCTDMKKFILRYRWYEQLLHVHSATKRLVQKRLSATQLSIFEIGVYCLNFKETWHLSFVVNLKCIKQFRTLHKKWRHIVTIPFHFEINVWRVFQLAWITIYYATFKIKGDLGRHQACNLRIMLISPLISHGLT